MADLRVYRIPRSMHVGRIALATAHKALDVEWIDVDPEDRRAVRRVSGQDLVPVVEDPADGRIVVGSGDILRWLEARWPDRPLWPSDPGDAALADVFCRRFDDVWLGPPTRLAAILGPVGFDGDALSSRERRAVDDDAGRMRTWTGRFEERLADGDHLGGATFGICDVVAHPFLRHGILAADVGDRDPLRRVLREYGAIDAGTHPRLDAWVRRVEPRP